MTSLSQHEYEAKVKAIQEVFIDELWKIPWNTRVAAERAMQAIEQVEIDEDERRYEISQANAN